MSEELKPCPFCNAELMVHSEQQGYTHPLKNCPLSGFVMLADGYSEERWNTRTPPPPSLHREPIQADYDAADRFTNPKDTPIFYRLLVKAFTAHRLAFSTPAASDAEALDRAAKAVHEVLTRANVTAYLDMPQNTAEVAARAVIASLPVAPIGAEAVREAVAKVIDAEQGQWSRGARVDMSRVLQRLATSIRALPLPKAGEQFAENAKKSATPSTEGRKGEDQADG